MSRRRRVVILRPLGLGDFCAAVPAYHAIRRAFPDEQCTLAAPAPLRELAMLTGAFDDFVETRPLEPLPPRLHGALCAIDLHGRGPASQRVLLASRPKRLIAFRNAAVPRTYESAAWRDGEHEVHRWCRLLHEAGIAADPRELDLAVPRVGPRLSTRTALVHVGAASASRRWPVARWAVVTRQLRALGLATALSGGDADSAAVSELAGLADIPTGMVFAGKTTLIELASLVASAALVICADTGVAHLATAYRRPSVVLFGPIPPAEWGPPARPIHRVIWKGGRGDPHGDRIDPALDRLEATEVCTELSDLLAQLDHRGIGLGPGLILERVREQSFQLA